jgi:hypothetical protein
MTTTPPTADTTGTQTTTRAYAVADGGSDGGPSGTTPSAPNEHADAIQDVTGALGSSQTWQPSPHEWLPQRPAHRRPDCPSPRRSCAARPRTQGSRSSGSRQQFLNLPNPPEICLRECLPSHGKCIVHARKTLPRKQWKGTGNASCR